MDYFDDVSEFSLQDHLALMMELLGTMPRKVSMSGVLLKNVEVVINYYQFA